MSKIEWNDVFLLGVQPIDEHNQYLFELVNNARTYFNEGIVSDDFGLVIDALTEYTINHFKAEEQMMTAMSYPEFADHKEEHDSFAVWVAEIQKEFHNGSKSFPCILLAFLNHWVVDHISKTDFRFGHFITSCNK